MLAAFILALFLGMEACGLDVFLNAVEGLFESVEFWLCEVVFLDQVADFVGAFPGVVLLHMLVHCFLEVFEYRGVFPVDASVCFVSSGVLPLRMFLIWMSTNWPRWLPSMILL